MDLTKKQPVPSDSHTGGYVDISDLVPEASKNKKPYLKGNMDYSIRTLVIEDPLIQKAINLHHGERDPEEYAYLEKNHGIGTPAKIAFVPLVRKHIQVMLGMEASNPLSFKVSTSDSKSVDKAGKEYKQQFSKEVMQRAMAAMQEQQTALMEGRTPNQEKINQLIGDQALAEIQRYFQQDWQTDIEIMAQELVNYNIHDRDKALKLNFNTMLEDLMVNGRAQYRCWVDEVGTDPDFKLCNPKNLFFHKSTNSKFIKNCTRIVHREWMTRTDIINQYGHLLEPGDLEELGCYQNKEAIGGSFITDGTLLEQQHARWGSGNTYHSESQGLDMNMSLPVYHVEWLANNWVLDSQGKKRYRLDRYEGYRIGEKIYFGMGKSKHINRRIDKPFHCTLTYNGLFYNDRNGKPYSFVLSTKHLQDKYDILNFHQDNTFARAGGKGVITHLDAIPVEFGNTPDERIMKNGAHLKNGQMVVAPMDGTARGFNNFGTYDMSMDAQGAKALQDMMTFIEDTVSSITGISRQMLAQITPEDGLGTSNMAMQQSGLITKPFFMLMTELKKEVFTDLVNNSRIAYKNGKKGSYLLGNMQQKLFTVDPKKFCVADYDVHVTDGVVEAKQLEKLEQLAIKFIDNQMIDAEVAIDMVTLKNLSQAKENLRYAVREGKTSQISSLQQQVKQLTDQLNEAIKTLKFVDDGNTKARMDEVQIKRDELDWKMGSEDRKQGHTEVVDIKGLEQEDDRISLERDQAIMADTSTNNEIKND